MEILIIAIILLSTLGIGLGVTAYVYHQVEEALKHETLTQHHNNIHRKKRGRS